MNGFAALTTFSRWDGTAEGLVPCLEAIESTLSAMLESFTAETDTQKKKRGVSVLALLAARSNVQHVLENARGGEAPDPIAVTRLVAEVGAVMFWGLAIDAQHGITLRVKGHRPSEVERDRAIAERVDTLRRAGVKQPFARLRSELEAKGVHMTLGAVRKADQRGRKVRGKDQT